MLLLTSTSDLIQVITGSAASVDVHASWVDNNAGTITPGRTNTVGIGAATTTIVAAPAASTQRNVKFLDITNTHASVATTVTVIHTDGTNVADLMGVTLLAGENLVLTGDGEWRHHDTNGGEYGYSAPARPTLGPAGTLAETMPRETCPEVNTVAPTASGTLFLQAIYLQAGQLVSNITMSTATTAAGTPTHYWFALYGGGTAPALLAQSADQTSTAWAATTVKTLAMTTPYRVPTSGLYYIGIAMVATTVCTLKGGTARTGGQLASVAPIIAGASSTGLTTALPNPAAAITANSLVSIYASVS